MKLNIYFGEWLQIWTVQIKNFRLGVSINKRWWRDFDITTYPRCPFTILLARLIGQHGENINTKMASFTYNYTPHFKCVQSKVTGSPSINVKARATFTYVDECNIFIHRWVQTNEPLDPDPIPWISADTSNWVISFSSSY